ncbi:chemotaxis protein CheW [Azoarcus sp. KH32C]|uniref:chemotaxis protein CheW n=1 Tax=Azoarcus sp. KH32C TaxID=748247 RepID=UPI0002385B98|nr:chemotaxis protein CheW [Azoarcus sp. KH32C]BAL27275.1 hypothetical protein AZKH_p0392 [Azoarcus sp. KH32C]
MLFLLFQLGEERYVLDTASVAEVLPLVGMRPIPHAPPGLAGVFSWRGTPLPAIDLAQLILGRPARRRLSTRLILVDYPAEAGGPTRLGLIAEGVTETVRLDPADFTDAGPAVDAAPYLGPVANDGRGLVQRFELRHLLPTTWRGLLSAPEAARALEC